MTGSSGWSVRPVLIADLCCVLLADYLGRTTGSEDPAVTFSSVLIPLVDRGLKLQVAGQLHVC